VTTMNPPFKVGAVTQKIGKAYTVAFKCDSVKLVDNIINFV
jgi:hypothetical protein